MRRLSPSGVGKRAFILYITCGLNQNKEEQQAVNSIGNMVFDAKIAVTSSLNLDLTVNPDFSQIEVDQQVTNLTRFNIFFPERRTFFLENADLFAGYGIPPILPFYSRRIELDDEEIQFPFMRVPAFVVTWLPEPALEL